MQAEARFAGLRARLAAEAARSAAGAAKLEGSKGRSASSTSDMPLSAGWASGSAE